MLIYKALNSHQTLVWLCYQTRIMQGSGVEANNCKESVSKGKEQATSYVCSGCLKAVCFVPFHDLY